MERHGAHGSSNFGIHIAFDGEDVTFDVPAPGHLDSPIGDTVEGGLDGIEFEIPYNEAIAEDLVDLPTESTLTADELALVQVTPAALEEETSGDVVGNSVSEPVEDVPSRKVIHGGPAYDAGYSDGWREGLAEGKRRAGNLLAEGLTRLFTDFILSEATNDGPAKGAEG